MNPIIGSSASTVPEITTDRLLLRGPRAADFPVYESFYADADASAHYGGPLRADQAWRQLAIDLGHWQIRGYGLTLADGCSEDLEVSIWKVVKCREKTPEGLPDS